LSGGKPKPAGCNPHLTRGPPRSHFPPMAKKRARAKRREAAKPPSRFRATLRAVSQLRLLRTAVLILAAIGVWIGINYENLRELALAREERDAQLAVVEEMERSLEAMRHRHQALEREPSAVERSAREQFKMTMPGETLVGIEREASED